MSEASAAAANIVAALSLRLPQLPLAQRRASAGIIAHSLGCAVVRQADDELFTRLFVEPFFLDATYRLLDLKREAVIGLLPLTVAGSALEASGRSPFVAELPPRLAELLPAALLCAYVADGIYDARVRELLRRIARLCGVPWAAFGAQEDALAALLQEQSAAAAAALLAPRGGEGALPTAAGGGGASRWKTVARWSAIGTAAVLGAGLLIVTGGLAAPGLLMAAATAGAAVGLGGTAAAVMAFFSSAAGTAIVISLFGAAGGGLAGYRVARRTADVTLFRFARLTAPAPLESGEERGERATAREGADAAAPGMHAFILCSGLLVGDDCEPPPPAAAAAPAPAAAREAAAAPLELATSRSSASASDGCGDGAEPPSASRAPSPPSASRAPSPPSASRPSPPSPSPSYRVFDDFVAPWGGFDQRKDGEPAAMRSARARSSDATEAARFSIAALNGGPASASDSLPAPERASRSSNREAAAALPEADGSADACGAEAVGIGGGEEALLRGRRCCLRVASAQDAARVRAWCEAEAELRFCADAAAAAGADASAVDGSGSESLAALAADGVGGNSGSAASPLGGAAESAAAALPTEGRARRCGSSGEGSSGCAQGASVDALSRSGVAQGATEAAPSLPGGAALFWSGVSWPRHLFDGSRPLRAGRVMIIAVPLPLAAHPTLLAPRAGTCSLLGTIVGTAADTASAPSASSDAAAPPPALRLLDIGFLSFSPSPSSPLSFSPSPSPSLEFELRLLIALPQLRGLGLGADALTTLMLHLCGGALSGGGPDGDRGDRCCDSFRARCSSSDGGSGDASLLAPRFLFRAPIVCVGAIAAGEAAGLQVDRVISLPPRSAVDEAAAASCGGGESGGALAPACSGAEQRFALLRGDAHTLLAHIGGALARDNARAALTAASAARASATAAFEGDERDRLRMQNRSLPLSPALPAGAGVGAGGSGEDRGSRAALPPLLFRALYRAWIAGEAGAEAGLPLLACSCRAAPPLPPATPRACALSFQLASRRERFPFALPPLDFDEGAAPLATPQLSAVGGAVSEAPSGGSSGDLLRRPPAAASAAAAAAASATVVASALRGISAAASRAAALGVYELRGARGWWRRAVPHGDPHTLLWEPHALRAATESITRALSSYLSSQALSALIAHTLLAGLAAAWALPSLATSALSWLDAPWAVALNRADRAGALLAAALLAGAHGRRPVTLVGFGLGARVVFVALRELAAAADAEDAHRAPLRAAEAAASSLAYASGGLSGSAAPPDRAAASLARFLPPPLARAGDSAGRGAATGAATGGGTLPTASTAAVTPIPLNPRGIVHDAVMIGAPVSADGALWQPLRRVVAGRLVNAYAPADLVLRFASGLTLQFGVAGLRPLQESGESGGGGGGRASAPAPATARSGAAAEAPLRERGAATVERRRSEGDAAAAGAPPLVRSAASASDPSLAQLSAPPRAPPAPSPSSAAPAGTAGAADAADAGAAFIAPQSEAEAAAAALLTGADPPSLSVAPPPPPPPSLESATVWAAGVENVSLAHLAGAAATLQYRARLEEIMRFLALEQ